MPCPALFLDRDGVINVDHGYVVTHDRFQFVDGIFDLARAAMDRGYRVAVITNQSGIARGIFQSRSFWPSPPGWSKSSGRAASIWRAFTIAHTIGLGRLNALPARAFGASPPPA